jgi:hypothetical protein
MGSPPSSAVNGGLIVAAGISGDLEGFQCVFVYGFSPRVL